MRLHFFVEGPSEKQLLDIWLPRFLPPQHAYKIIPHKGKGRIPGDPLRKPDPKRQGLLDQLPAKLRAYGKNYSSATDRIVVLVDLDNDDCQILKQKMLDALSYCDPAPEVLFRIAIEEVEAFYLGDIKAIRKAFPINNVEKISNYTQDSICGTWELFQEIINETCEDKVGWARKMGAHLTTKWRGVEANNSPSFQQLCKGILRLAGENIE